MPPLRSEDSSWQLRQLCSRKGIPCDEVIAFLEQLPSEERQEIVQKGNSNGKRPLHYAAQLRPKDGAHLCAALLQAEAELDATTRRGHTALLFAAGRGHGEVVRFLLSARANPRIVAASGEAPWNCASPHLDTTTRALLMEAEASDTRTLVDYREVEDARIAQVEYERASLACRARRVEDDPVEQVDLPMEVGLARAIVSSLCLEPAVLTAAIVAAAVDDKFALRTAVRMIFSQDDADKALPAMLRACREEGLMTLELSKRNRRVRNAASARILTALFIEIRNTNAAAQVPVAELVNATLPDVVLTMEVLFARGSSEDTRDQFLQWWEKATSMATKNKYFGEMAWTIVGNQQNQGRQKPFALCRDWVLLLRWATCLGTSKDLHQVVEMVVSAGRRALMLEILPDLSLPDTIKAQLREMLDKTDEVEKPSFVAERCISEKTLPLYEPKVAPCWVESIDEVIEIRKVLESKMSVGQQLQVGLDSEWGCIPDAPPSVFQLAIRDFIWVVDASALPLETGSLLTWLLETAEIQLLGFHFNSDVARLKRLVQSELPWNKVIDLQREAMRRQLIGGNGHMPGLNKLCEIYLAKLLDKSLQCSNWDERPLSAEQICYAGSDAAVLLDIADAMLG